MTGDPKQLWRAQPNDGPDMGLDLVRRRVAAQSARVVRSRWILGAIALAGVMLSSAAAYTLHQPLLRLGELLLAAGFVGVFLVGWSRTMTASSSDEASECVAYLRDRLIAQRRFNRGGWVLMVAPLLPGLVVLLGGQFWLAGGALLPRLGPVVLLLLVWGGAMLIGLRRARRRVKVEMAELDRLRLSDRARRAPSGPSGATSGH
jgi:hypothetical protein